MAPGPVDRLEIGFVAKAHGLAGEVVVRLVSNRPDLRMVPGAVMDAEGSELVVESARAHGRDWLVRFAGVADRDAADALRGRLLHAEPVEDPDVLWVHELVGTRVVDTAGRELGIVATVVANPASDLLELDDGGLVPLTFVVTADETTVVVDPPEGLLD